MPKTLAKVQSTEATAVVPSGGVRTEMSVIMPPGFQAPVDRPMIYIGGESEGGPCFYTWNSEESARDYVPVNRFSANLLELRTVVYNPDDKLTRSVKLIAEFQTPSGARVAMCCGANTWAAVGLIGGLSACTSEQVRGLIGLSGKSGKSGKVTFINVYANGDYMRNHDADELLKEAKADGVLEEAIKGYVAEINARLQANEIAEIKAALPGNTEEDDAELPF